MFFVFVLRTLFESFGLAPIITSYFGLSFQLFTTTLHSIYNFIFSSYHMPLVVHSWASDYVFNYLQTLISKRAARFGKNIVCSSFVQSFDVIFTCRYQLKWKSFARILAPVANSWQTIQNNVSRATSFIFAGVAERAALELQYFFWQLTLMRRRNILFNRQHDQCQNYSKAPEWTNRVIWCLQKLFNMGAARFENIFHI